MNEPVRIGSEAEFQASFGELSPDYELGYAVKQFFVNGGTDAWVVRVADGAAVADWQAGIVALGAVDIFNLLVLPGVTAPPVIAAAVTYCERRRASCCSIRHRMPWHRHRHCSM
jgi:hypothetical protein